MKKRLSFERKLIAAFFMAAIFPIIVQYIVSFAIIDKQFDNVRSLRYETVHGNLKKTVDSMKQQLQLTNLDYAHWDEMYQNTINKNHEWLEDVFNNLTSEAIGIETIYVIDGKGEIVHEHNPKAAFFRENSRCVNSALNGNDISSIVNLHGRLFIISFVGIVDAENTGARSGVLVMAKPITEKTVEAFPQTYDFEADILFDGRGIKSGKAVDGFDRLLVSNDQSLKLQDSIRYYRLKDHSGNTVALLEIKEVGNYTQEAMLEAHKSFYAVMAIIIFLMLFFIIFLKNNIMHPLRELRGKVSQMRNGYYNQSEKDEIIALTQEFEAMSEEISCHTAEIEEQNKALQYLVYRDDITKSYNKRFFRMKYTEEFNYAVNERKSLCLGLLDIDYFKLYRELLGVKERDAVLSKISRIIEDYFDSKCYICFDGTDEFRLIMPDMKYKDAVDTMKLVTAEISKESFVGMEKLPTGSITVSSGVANYPKDADSEEKLYYAAMDRLHRAKHHNQGNVGYFYSIFNDIREDIHSDRKTLIYATKAFLAVIDAMDEYTYTHTEGVVRYTEIITEALKLEEDAREDIKIGALLHDIGKLELGRELLNKKERLTEEEIQLIRKHPIYGVTMLKTLTNFDGIADIVKYHHERYDGKGYPYGICGEEIPLGARIVAIADSFDAMTTVRAYRQAHKSFEEATEELLKCAGAQFDPHIVKLFVDYIKRNNYNLNIIK